MCRDPVEQFTGAPLCSLPSHAHQTRPGHRVAHRARTMMAGRNKPFPMPVVPVSSLVGRGIRSDPVPVYRHLSLRGACRSMVLQRVKAGT